MEISQSMLNPNFEAFLKSIQAHPLLDIAIPYSSYIPLDLSVDNAELNSVDVSSSDALEAFIWSIIKKNKARVAYGGYLEKRGIYNRSSYFNKSNPETERNIHLGLDLWIEANAPIFAPLDGEIHSFKNNTNHGDYGPTLVLKHSITDFNFYTLYGHLSAASLQNNKVGDKVTKGQQIATLGTASVNGDYPPHLHFQIIRDIQNFNGDYPGVSNSVDLEFYKSNCPDPNLLLGLY